jgi:hypothetical protein
MQKGSMTMEEYSSGAFDPHFSSMFFSVSPCLRVSY